MLGLRAHKHLGWSVTHLGWRRWSVLGILWPPPGARARGRRRPCSSWGSSSFSRVLVTSSMSSGISVTFSRHKSLLTWALRHTQSASNLLLLVQKPEILKRSESEHFYQYEVSIKSYLCVLMEDVTLFVTGVMSVTALSRILVTRVRGIWLGVIWAGC